MVMVQPCCDADEEEEDDADADDYFPVSRHFWIGWKVEHPSPEPELGSKKALFASFWILLVYILNSHYTKFRLIL